MHIRCCNPDPNPDPTNLNPNPDQTVRVWIAEAIAEACPDGADKKMMGKVWGSSE